MVISGVEVFQTPLYTNNLSGSPAVWDAIWFQQTKTVGEMGGRKTFIFNFVTTDLHQG